MKYKIKLDKERVLIYNNRALVEAEKRLGLGLLKLFTDPDKLQSLEVISILVWAGLLSDDDLTEEFVIDNLNVKDLAKTITTVTEAIMAAIGLTENGEADEEEKKELAKSTGTA